MKTDRNKVIYLSGQQVQRGRLIERVLKEHGPALKRFLQMRLALEEDQEDIIQDLFVRLTQMENLAERLASESGSTRCYLFSILNSLITDLQRRYLRRGGQHESYNDDCIPTRVQAPEPVNSSRQLLDRSMEVIMKLSDRHRQAFVLHRFKNMGYREIADEMGVSMTSVERYISRALAVLRKELKEGMKE